MPKLLTRPPKYCRHRASGQAVVKISRRLYYLGPWGSPESKAEYHKKIAAWNKEREQSLAAAGAPPLAAPMLPQQSLTIGELILRFWKHAELHYRKRGETTDELACYKSALAHLNAAFGAMLAKDFGPGSLDIVRQRMIDTGNCRGYINKQVKRIRHMFKWAAARELVPGATYGGLLALESLEAERTAARETPPVLPVADDVVDKTIPHLSEVVADMVQFEQLTGARPHEVCDMKPCEIDRTGDVWLYRPSRHKMEHKQRGRVIPIGPRAQAILRRYLFVGQNRQPAWWNDQPCFKAKRGGAFITRTYREAIHRAVDRANRKAEKAGSHERLPLWNPNQLRHSAATRIRDQFDLEAAGTVLGHALGDTRTTEIYAEPSLRRAMEVAKAVG